MIRKRNNTVSPNELLASVHRAASAFADGLELGSGEALVMAALAGGPASVQQLHLATGRRRSTLTSVLDRLEKRRLLKRTIDPADRRSFRIVPTGPGRRMARRMKARLDRLAKSAFGRWRPGDRRRLAESLERLVAPAGRAR